MRLTAPTIYTFIISLVLMGLAVATRYFGVEVPVIQSDNFAWLLGGYGVLVLGNVVRGL